MLQYLGRLWSFLGVVAEHPFHQAYCFWRSPWNYSLQIHLRVLRHCEKFAICQSFCIWPVVIIRLAQDHRDLLKLVHF